MEDKKYSYNIVWQQRYDQWSSSNRKIEETIESIIELALEYSDYEEAKSVISRVRGL